VGQLVAKGFLAAADLIFMKKMLVLYVVIALLGCSGTDSPKNEFLGTWRMENRSGQHTIMSLKNNGTFEIDLRIEGKLTKIVDKVGNATGAWTVSETGDQLVLDITQGGASIGWPEGETAYRIEQFDKLHLVLISPDGRTLSWKKSGVTTSESQEEETGPAITVAPLVVSLVPSSNDWNQRYKWLCVAMDIQLQPGTPEQTMRPQWKDKVILYLSSKTYEEINTMDKLTAVSNEIRILLNPYLGGAINKVVFKRTIVTGMQEAVDTFCAEFEE
jgi:hypothetical protein